MGEGEAAGRRRCQSRNWPVNPLFAGVAKPFLHWNEGAVVRRHYKKGDIICREGDYGSTAFYIEKGKVSIFHQRAAQARQGAEEQTAPAPR